MSARQVWVPQPKQLAFLARPEYEALYGGAAGGGKSDALLVEALRQVHIPHYRALILRKTYPQLSELIDRSREIYKRAFPRARFNKTEHGWYFPSGAIVYFGSMQHEQDRTNYQGKRYDLIAFDELTHFSYAEYTYLFSRNRPSGPGTRVYMRAATNPGGIGHGWVKDRFIAAAPPMTTIWTDVPVADKDGKVTIKRRSRIFVPASVYDNAALLRNDPMYIANLGLLPQADRDALLYGSWDSFSGKVFREFRDDPAHYDDRRWTHVIAPFKIPKYWNVYRGFDWGYSKPFSVGWYAADPDGKIYRIAEYYGCNGTPDVGISMEPVQLASKIREIESKNENLKGKNIIGIADPNIFKEDGGESTAALMEKRPNYVFFGKGDHSRIAGKMQLHYRLAFDENGECMFQVFDTCPHFIRTINSLVYSVRDVEDVDSDGEDHAYDECRYVLMASPISPRAPVQRKPPGLDPLNLRKPDRDPYRFYRI